jgi:2-oxo-3-hexenedioate decarboxylase
VAALPPEILAAPRAQLQARRALLDAGARRVGWKIALGIPEVEELIGADPVLGYLTSATLLEPGATYSPAADRGLRAETELAVEVGEGGRIAGLAVALELVDVGRPPDGMDGIVAANVFHRAVAFAPTRQGAALSDDARARLRVGGDVREEGPVRGDPVATVRAAERLLGAVGERLEPGDLILAGASCHVPAGPGDEAVAEIDGLGEVGARIAATG